ncbi:MAG TPA: glycosyltransferase family 2 protein [Bryobacteraceae bacterium]|jgi:GT2 family glycosyltransferase|nr:glycosyltransferase family 2 protein [Bryobacteraceae bacterium]
MPTSVSVTIVTYNSRPYVEACLQSIFEQDYHPLEIVVVDNGSLDGTRGFLSRFEDRIRVQYNDDNEGFATAQNQAIAMSTGDWVLVLNPDVVLLPGVIEHLVEAGRIDEKAGTICGRLLAIGRDLKPLEHPLIDTAGIYFTEAMRHFDRGWHEPDDGRFRKMEYVFGASAAAALYRREMIADISEGGNFFDLDFFAYREDADVAWRAQLLGWRCLYTPAAVGYHVRSVGPGNRRDVPAVINMHSVKNRFLMRTKNMTAGVFRRFWRQMIARDLLVIGGSLLLEQKSLPAFWRLAKCLPRALRSRRWIMSRRRATDENLAEWFSTKPSTRPVPEVALPTKSLDALSRGASS